MRKFCFAAVLTAMFAAAAAAQVTPAPASTPPDDTPKYNIGATLFADYTYNQSPETKDADGNLVHNSSFNVTRAYINVTGNLNHWIAFRITPDVARETGSGTSLNGSQEFRLKFAYAQFNLDDWWTKGSWVRFGVQQTPYIDFNETAYRYRFQGSVFPERVGLLSGGDAGVTVHYNLPNNYGDIHGGFYNGENYFKSEVNNEKGLEIRGTVRPLPQGGPLWKGLRVSAFLVEDHYVENAKRERIIGTVLYEHPRVNFGIDVLRAKDRTSVTKAETDSKGWAFWVTPKFGKSGFEALIRHDNYTPNDKASSQKQKRDIDGIAYWFPKVGNKAVAVLLDRDSLKRTNVTPSVPNTTNYEVKMLVSF